MKVTKRELIKIWNVLESIHFSDLNKKFSYCIIRNKKKFKDEIDALKEVQAPNEKFLEYERKRLILCENLCERDESGKPILEKNNYVFTPENRIKVDEAIKDLAEENKDIIQEQNKRDKEFESILDEYFEVDVHKISFDDFPERISPSNLEALEEFIDTDK